jgi:hypothetical protein
VQATAHHPDGPVKKAAAPGIIPPPVDPNKSPPGGPEDKSKSSSAKVRTKGPKKDGTKVPDKDNRPKGKRHAFQDAALMQWALDELNDDD